MVKQFAKILFVFACLTKCYSQSEMQQIEFEKENNCKLNFYLHIPKGERLNCVLMPLVVVMHGCAQSAQALSQQSGWNELADKFGFYVLYPQQRLLKNPNNCFNWFVSKNVIKDNGEVYCIKQSIDFVIKKYCIDTNRVFVYGLSAGACMAGALMACYPNNIAGGALLAGMPYIYSDEDESIMTMIKNVNNFDAQKLASFVKKQNPNYIGKYPRIVVVQGKKDIVVDYENAYQIIRQWLFLNNSKDNDFILEHNFLNQIGIDKKIYFDSEKKPIIYYYEVENLGHALMVDPGTGAFQGGEIGTFAIDKDFFSTYWIAKDFGLIP